MLHGRAQQGRDSIALRDAWIMAFNRGRAEVGKPAIATADVIFPFYGDTLSELVRDIQMDDASIRARGVAGNNAVLEAEYEIARELQAKAGITDDDILQEYQGDLVERGPLNWEWVQSLFRVLDRCTKAGNWGIHTYTRDTSVYLVEEGLRNVINQIVIDAIGDETAIWVTHSMGTVIAFDVLSRNEGIVAPEFHTIGSPLGIRAIRSRLSGQNRRPGGVGIWANFYDERDVVPLYPLTPASGWNLEPQIDNHRVRNLNDNDPHDILGYLAEETFSGACS